MKAESFEFILEQKIYQDLTWDDIAEAVNKKHGTNVSGQQVQDLVQRGKVPFGGFLVLAIEEVLGIPPRPAKAYKSFVDAEE